MVVCLTSLVLLLRLSTNFDSSLRCGDSADDDDDDDVVDSGPDDELGCVSILLSSVNSCDSKLVVAVAGFGVRNPNVYLKRLPLFERVVSFLIAFSLPILIGTLVDNSSCFSTSSSFNVEHGENRCNDVDDDADEQKVNVLFSEPDGKCYKS